ncbi:MAG: topoisomerase DNA-binding C4 zinc finger domain-containing protein [Gammaproteobacteria bacterium]
MNIKDNGLRLYIRKDQDFRIQSTRTKHDKAVQNLLSADSNIIFNVVVFAGNAKFKTKMPANVVTKSNLRGYIRSHREALVKSNDIEKYATIIERAAKESAVSHKEHIKSIRKNQRNPVCPRCGAAMVLRTAKTGRYKGSKFWGCSKYPECRATKRHD